MEPALGEDEIIKKDPETGLNMMFPAGITLLDSQGLPIKVDGQEVLLIPQMEDNGKYPRMDPKTPGTPCMYPQGLVMRGAAGQPILLDGKHVIMYPMLDP